MKRLSTLVLAVCHLHVVLSGSTAYAQAAVPQPGDEALDPSSLFVASAPPPAEAAPPPRAVMPTFVATIDQVAELTAKDKAFADQVYAYNNVRRNARSVLIMGLLSGIGMFAIGTAMGLSCENEMPRCSDGSTLKPVGAGVAVLGVLAWWISKPSKEDFVSVVNNWNARHPTQPLYPY